MGSTASRVGMRDGKRPRGGARTPALAAPPPPFRRRVAFEELESRLLMSADLNPLASDSLLAAPAPNGAEFRTISAAAPSVVITTGTAAVRRTAEIAFVDTATPEYARLVEGMRETALAAGRDLEVVLIDRGEDGLRTITETLARKTGLDAVHIVSHGEAGSVQLGHARLDFVALAAHATQIKGWGEALGANADLLIYGCHVAATAEGRSLVDALARLTGADVAASDDFTGASSLGGDWALEYNAGTVEARAAAGDSTAWQGVLAVVPDGGEVMVNTTTADTQAEAAVARAGDGSYVVAWASNNQDGNAYGVYARRYDAAGVAQGAEFRVNAYTSNDQRAPAIAMDGSGNFVVVWQSENQDGSNTGIYGRRYDAAGVALGAEFRINTYVTSEQSRPAVAMNAAGAFVVLWESNGQDGGNLGVYGQRFNAAGIAQGTEFRVNNVTVDRQEAPAVAMDDAGNFVAAWQSKDQDGDGFGIYARRYDALGVAQGTEFRINNTTSKDQSAPAVAIDPNDGNFVVAWASNEQDGDKWGVYARRYTAAGVAQGNEFLVNVYTTKDQEAPAIAMAQNGTFAVVWQSEKQLPDDDKFGIFARTFAANGTPQGGEFRVNTYLTNDQLAPAIAIDRSGAGNLVVVWSGDGSTDGQGVFAQRYSAPNATPTGLPTISGTATEDQTLTANTAAIADADGLGAFAYQWARSTDGGLSWIPIAAATGTTYTLGDADVGALIRVAVSYTDGGGTAESLTSAAVGPIAGVNDAPVHSVPGAQSTAEDTALVFAGALAFSIADADLGAGLAQVSLTGTNGALTLSGIAGLSFSVGDGTADATMTFTGTIAAVNSALAGMSFLPTANFTGVAGITITTSDQGGSGSGGARSDTDSVTISVTPVNDAPVHSVPGAQSTPEDTALVFAGALAFSIADADLGAGLAQVSLTGTNGTLTLSGIAGLSFGVGDGTADATMTFTGTIAAVNSALAGMSFLPTPNFTGTAGITITTSDQGGSGSGGARSDTDSVTISVTPVNDAPVHSVPGAQSTAEDTALVFAGALAFSIADADLGAGLAQVSLTGTNGALTLSGIAGLSFSVGDGTADATMTFTGTIAAVNSALAGMSFLPTANFTGVAGITITTSDQGGSGSGGARSDTDSVTISVTPVNDAPVANNASASGNEDDAQIAITLTGSDVEGAIASLRLVGLPTNGVLYTDPGLTLLAAVATDYAAAGNARTFYFVPTANWNGTTSFQFTAVDGGGLADTTPANATITVAAVNDAPAGTNGAVATLMNTPRVLTAADFGFTDPDAGDSMSAVRIDSLPLLGTLSIGGVPLLLPGAVVSAGQLSAGDLVFTPVLLTSGTPYANFDFSVADAASVFDPTRNVLTINVLFVNSVPNGTNASVTTNEDVAHVFTVTNFGFTDPDAGDSLSAVRIETLPAAGTLTLNAVALTAGQVVVVADINAGLLRFTPAPDASGAGYASFTFSVRDTGGLAFDPTPNTMTINVTALNDAPAANDVSASGNEDDAQIAITLTGTDLEGPLASFRITGALPGNGVLYADAGLTTLAASGIDYAAVGNALTLYFVPAGNWNGATTFQYTAVDAGGVPDATPANATITVLPINDAPVANDVVANGNEDDAQIAITLTGSDVEGLVASFRLVGLPANGVLYTNAGLTLLAAVATDYTATGNARTLHFVPSANWNGSTGFQYTAVDGGGLADATPANATINVAAVNDAPVNSVPGPQSANEDSPLTLNTIAVNDAENNVTSVVLSVLNGTLAVTAAGGAAVAGGGTASVTINGPQAGINLTLASLIYQGNLNFSGTDTLTMTSTDAGSLQDIDPVTINVLPVNDAPAGTDTIVTTNEDVAHVFTVANFGFIDLDALDTMSAVRIDTLPAAGTLTLNAGALTAGQVVLVADINAGLLRLTPAPDTSGAPYTTFTFSVRDTGGAAFDPAPNTMTLNVTALNDAPAANDVSASGNEDDAQIAITLTGTDLEGPLASFRITGALPGNGVLYTDAGLTTLAAVATDYAAIGNALTLYFVPAGNWNGATAFQYTAVDAGGLPDATPANATINVLPINDAPVAADNAYAVSEDATLSVPLAPAGVLANDTDVDGPALSAVLVAGPANGVLALAANGTLTYTPNANFFGADTFTYRAFDGSASSNIATVTITVNNVADHTLIVDTEADSVNGDTTSIDALLANKGVDGLVSLREAILAANATANAGTPDLIHFAIAGSGPHTIALAATLPQISDAVVIDGTTEPDFAGTPVIVLDGNGGAGNGLRLASNGNTVRGLAIVDFGQVGILVNGTGNTIEGNYIGIAADGATAAGNQTYGVRVNAGGNVIGGTTAAQRNVISGNRIDGVYIAGGSGNVLQGNYIGTNAAGTVAVANFEDGIWIDGATNTMIGGTASGAGNLISGNGWSGVATLNGTAGTAIAGNRIGVTASGAGALGNQRHGVSLEGTGGVTVGGAPVGAANVIAYNVLNGVSITAGTGNAVMRNSIYSNGSLGIDIGNDGVTLNDAGDVDLGTSLGMNAPVIYSVTVSGGNVTIVGEARLGGTVEFFEAESDPTGYGEGRTFLGSGVVSGAVAGAADPTARRFSFTFAAGSMAVGDRLTATATDAGGNTSEFALNVAASALPPGISITPLSGLATTEDGGIAQFSVVLQSQPGADVTIAFSTSDTTEGTVAPASLTFTALNWNVAQIVTVTGVADTLTDGTVPYTLIAAAATSADPGYNGFDPADIGLNNLDGANDAPVNTVPGTQTTSEDTALVFSVANGNALSIADPDLGTGIAQVMLTAWNGALTLSGVAGLVFTAGDGTGDAAMTFTGTLADVNAALAGMSFMPAPNFTGVAAAGFTLASSDQGGSGSGGPRSDTDSVTVTVTPVNDPPAIGNLAGDLRTFTEGGGQVVIDAGSNATVTDIDSANFDGGTLTVSFSAGSDPAEDVLAIRNQGTGAGQIGVAGANVSYGGTNIGTFLGGTAGTNLVVTLNTNATPAAAQALLQNITYRNSDTDTPTAGARTVQFVLADGDGGASAPVNATVTVGAINDPPSATIVPAGYAATEQADLVLAGTGLSVADVDAGSGMVTVQLSVVSGTLTAAAGTTGATVVSGNGTSLLTLTGTVAQLNNLLAGGASATLTYRMTSDSPPASDNLTLSINDNGNTGSGGALSASDSATIAITAVNDPPINVLPGAAVTAEDTPLNFGSLISITELDAGPAGIAVTLGVTNGLLTLSGTAGLLFTTGSGSGDVTMSFTGTVAAVNAALNGLVFTPTADYDGPAILTLSTSDQGNTGSGGVLTDADSMTITVTPANDPPAGADATVGTLRDTPRAFTTGDFGFADSDAGDVLSGVRIDTLPTAGTLALSGVPVVATQFVTATDIAAGSFVFTPPAGATGIWSFTFSVADSGGAFDPAPNTLTVSVVAPVNNPPLGTDGAVATPILTPRTLVAADFGFVDPGDSMSGVWVDSDPNALIGTLSVGAGTFVTAAQLAAGNLVFTPLLLPGSTSFTFRVVDSGGLTDPSANTLTINVLFLNSAPEGTNSSVTINEDTPYTIAAANFGFTDPDAGDSLSEVRIDAPPTVGVLTLSGTAVTAGQIALAADLAAGRLVFTPAPNASGAPYASFSFSVRDSNGAFDGTPNVLTFAVNPVNDAPGATMTAASYTAVEQTPLPLAGTGLAVADIDSANLTAQLTVISGTLTVNPGTTGVTVSGSGGPVVVLNGTVAQINDLLGGSLGATIDYLIGSDSPPASDQLRLSVSDGALSPFPVPVRTIAIVAVNDPPVNTLPGAATTPEDTALVFSSGFGNQISIADVDAGGGSITVSLGATNGLLSLATTAGLTFTSGDGSADAAMAFTATQSAINAALNGLAFVPDLHFYGTAFLSLSTTDAGAGSDSDLTTITVTPVNDAPGGADAGVATTEDTPYVFSAADFGYSDVDVGDSMSGVRIDTFALPPGAALLLSGVPVIPGQIVAVADLSGNLTFTPAANASGAGYATLTFSVRDQAGAFDPAPKTLTIDVTPTNDPPTITSNGGGATAAVTIAENATAITTVTATDIDSAPAGFVYSIAGGADAASFAIDPATGVLRFAVAPNFEAPADAGADNVYDVTVSIDDGNGGADTQSIAITITNVNDAPVAVDDTYLTIEDTPLAIAAAGVLANDLDEDGAALVSTLVAGPANGTVTLNADGTFTYTPGVNFTGTDSFRYRVSDGALVSGVATVMIAVNPANVAPTAADGNVSSTAGQSYVFTIADFNYTDQDGDPLAYVTITALPAAGVLELNGVPVAPNQDVSAADIAAGRFRYVAPASGVSVTTFDFRAHDGIQYAAATNTITIGVVATPATLPPAPPADGGGGDPAGPPAAPPSPSAATTDASGPGAAPDADAPPSGGGRSGGSGGGDGGGDGAQQMQAAAADGGAATAVAGVSAPTVAIAGLSSGSAAEGLTLASREGGLDGLKVSDGSAHELAVKAEAKAIEAIAAPEFLGQLDKLREEQAQESALEMRVAGSVMVVSSGLSVGYVLWLLRGGVLLSSLLSSLPAWRLIDPLPVLGQMGGRADDEDDESLEEMVENKDADAPRGEPAPAPGRR